MARARKTWREKLEGNPNLPKIEEIPGKLYKSWGTGTVVVPHPREVDALMRRVPKGKVVTIQELRDALAKRHGTTIACPITTGIFAWISAHASVEAQGEGVMKLNPFWRTLKTGGELNPKYPGGIEAQKLALEAEGQQVVQKGKRWFVADYQSTLHHFRGTEK